jgi:fatty acid desaturase
LASNPIGHVATLLIISDLVSSYWLALFFQVSHIVKEVEWPLPNEKNEVEIDWAEMQLLTTQDYGHDSLFWTTITGALNYQAIHHLLPHVHQYYYPEIGPLVKQVCKEHGVSFLIKVSNQT